MSEKWPVAPPKTKTTSAPSDERLILVTDLGVFVNVKPAKGANVGANNPFDPFYWRFLVGTGGRFSAALKAGAAKLGEALKTFETTLGPQIQRLNRKGAQP